MTTEGAAWALERTRYRWLRLRLVGRIWLAVGVACLVGFLVLVNQFEDRRDDLVANGVRTTGTVLEDPPRALRCGQVPVDVSFEVEDETQVHQLYVGGCGGDGLSRGDAVTVYFDPADPSNFVTEESDNEAPLPTFAAVVGLVAGGFLIGGWALRARSLHGIRRTLESSRWTEHRVQVTRAPERWVRGRLFVSLLDSDDPLKLLTQSQTFSSHGTTESLRVARHGSSWVVGDLDDKYLLRARRA